MRFTFAGSKAERRDGERRSKNHADLRALPLPPPSPPVRITSIPARGFGDLWGNVIRISRFSRTCAGCRCARACAFRSRDVRAVKCVRTIRGRHGVSANLMRHACNADLYERQSGFIHALRKSVRARAANTLRLVRFEFSRQLLHLRASLIKYIIK